MKFKKLFIKLLAPILIIAPLSVNTYAQENENTEQPYVQISNNDTIENFINSVPGELVESGVDEDGYKYFIVKEKSTIEPVLETNDSPINGRAVIQVVYSYNQAVISEKYTVYCEKYYSYPHETYVYEKYYFYDICASLTFEGFIPLSSATQSVLTSGELKGWYKAEMRYYGTIYR